MINDPITLCLYTTTQGHFGRQDIYRQTVQGLLSQVPTEQWGDMYAHIQHTGEPLTEEMAEWLTARGFKVFTSHGAWRHFEQTHQAMYLLGMERLVRNVTTPYLLHCEDDWAFRSYDHDLTYWINEAVAMLEGDPNLVQVRIARFTDESNRILGLRAKHGIDGRVGPLDSEDKAFRHMDWSCNPFIARTRDLRAALAFLRMATNVPQHVEHGLGPMMKVLSGDPLPFACLNPARVRVGHQGVRDPSEADDLSKPLMAD